MKTATVRDLRNHFADVAKWIEEGGTRGHYPPRRNVCDPISGLLKEIKRDQLGQATDRKASRGKKIDQARN